MAKKQYRVISKSLLDLPVDQKKAYKRALYQKVSRDFITKQYAPNRTSPIEHNCRFADSNNIPASTWPYANGTHSHRHFSRTAGSVYDAYQASFSVVRKAESNDNEDDNSAVDAADTGIKAAAATKKIDNKYYQKRRNKQKAIATFTYGRSAANEAASEATNIVERLRLMVTKVFTEHKNGFIGFVILLMVILLGIVQLQSCSVILMQAVGSLGGTSWQAKDEELCAADLYYTKLEADLKYRINRIRYVEYVGYTEYRYAIGDFGHDATALVCYLNAVFGDFNASEIYGHLDALFSSQYKLIIRTHNETRYRVDMIPDDEGNLIPTQVAYDVSICTITMTSENLKAMLEGKMTPEQRSMYDIYMITGGNRRFLGSPVADPNWRSHTTSPYGYRVSPIDGNLQIHRGQDISMPEGTDILAVHDGTVTTATYHYSYGNYIAITGDDGYTTKYAHCSQLLIPVGTHVTKGQVIAKSGNTGQSTGPHLHIEVLKGTNYYNPIFYLS